MKLLYPEMTSWVHQACRVDILIIIILRCEDVEKRLEVGIGLYIRLVEGCFLDFTMSVALFVVDNGIRSALLIFRLWL